MPFALFLRIIPARDLSTAQPFSPPRNYKHDYQRWVLGPASRSCVNSARLEALCP